jgi:hypothetical protein
MNTYQTETLPTVDPARLEQAYTRCSHLFKDTGLDETVSASTVLDTLQKTQPLLDQDETVDLFRRLCLTVQLVADIDANWDDAPVTGERPTVLPLALYQLASTETAFEQAEDGYASTFFARDVLDDAFSMLRPN